MAAGAGGARLAGVQAPWYVAAGWAIDLFLGEERREHEDLEIAVPRVGSRRSPRAVGIRALRPQRSDRSRTRLALCQAPTALVGHHQTWVREPESGRWRLDVFREPSDGDVWIYRRDERIRLPYPDVIARTDGGIPFARPEVVLLFKAKRTCDRRTRPTSRPCYRGWARTAAWLADAIRLVHPGHPWSQRL